MKIAVLIPGYLRFWEECKPNFLQCIYNTNHSIDVFVDTYTSKFRSDYQVRDENNHAKNITSDEIHSFFKGINVVDFSIEPELSGVAPFLQKRKLLRLLNTYSQYEQDHGKYDLVVKTRFDIQVQQPIEYDNILLDCSKKIYISTGGTNCPPKQNDMLAVSNTDNIKIYLDRFGKTPEEFNYDMIHHGVEHIESTRGIEICPNINISIMRFEGNEPKLF